MDKDSKLEIIRRLFWPTAKTDLWFEILSFLAKPHHEILEIGSGSGQGLQNQLYPQVAKVVGLDLDRRVLQNPHLDQALNISAYEINKYLSEIKFDIIYSQMVAEHIDEPDKFISLQLNHLKDEGVLIHSTVSKFYWVSLINDFVPVIWKNWLIKTLGSGREADDIFPAYYKLNSAGQIKTMCKRLKLEYEIIRQDEPPGYLRKSFFLMIVYTLAHKPLQLIFPALRPSFIFILSRAA